MANMEMPPVEELVARFKKLYTGIVADAMDKLGMRDRLLPQYLRPLKPDMVIAGPAFTGCGEEVTDINCNDNDIRFSMLESIKPYDIPVWQTNMTDGCAHWGGIMTRSTRQAGGCGAIIDGGCRDCNDILEQGFPVFVRFFHCGKILRTHTAKGSPVGKTPTGDQIRYLDPFRNNRRLGKQSQSFGYFSGRKRRNTFSIQCNHTGLWF